MKRLIACLVLLLLPPLAAAQDCAESGLSYRAEKSENVQVNSRCSDSGQLLPGDSITLKEMGSFWLVARESGSPPHEVICQNYSASEFDLRLASGKPWLTEDEGRGGACSPWRDGMLSCSADGVEQALFCALTQARTAEPLEQPRLTTALTVRGSADSVITNSTIQDNQHAAQVIHSQMAAIEFCGRKEQYTGTITMSWLIAPGGKAARIEVLSADRGDPDVEACMKQWISGWHFPDISQLNQRVQYTFTLD